MLTVHRAERADRLVDALAGDPRRRRSATRSRRRSSPSRHAASSGGSPSGSSNVLGTSAGSRRRRLRQRRVPVPRPARRRRPAAAVTGIDPADDPWAPARAVWPLLAGHRRAPRRGLDGDARSPPRRQGHRRRRPARARRFGAARHLADLFDRYGVHRPGDGRALGRRRRRRRRRRAAARRTWRGRRRCGGCCASAHRRAEPGRAARARRASGCATSPDLARRCRTGCRCSGSPASRRAMLRRARRHRRRPATCTCSCCTRRRRCGTASRRATARPRPTRRQPAARDVGQGRPRDAARARRRRVGATTPSITPASRRPTRCCSGCRPTSAPTSAPPGAPLARRARRRGASSAAGDDSVQVHSCHGRARQVEVLRDAILHLLADDPTLEPRDVIVMCPDIETFAPLDPRHVRRRATSAGDGARRDGPPEPAASGSPTARCARPTPCSPPLAELLDLAPTRVTASAARRLRRPRAGAAAVPPRRRRPRPDRGVGRARPASAGASTPPIGRRSSSTALGANTWRAGLDRLLLGVGMTEDELPLVGGVLPLDDVDSGDIDLAGRLAELVDRVARRGRRADAGRSRSPSWAAAIAAAADALTALRAARRLAARASSTGCSHDVVAEVERRAAADEPCCRCRRLRTLLADRLRGRPSRANFRTGHLTVCTLVPMRSVPHRVVCLLGLDDGVVPAPRRARRRRHPRAGAGGRRPRRPQRGPPAAARRPARRRRPPRRHLQRARRAHERRPSAVACRSASCSTSSTPPRVAATGPARDQVVDRAPAAAVRRPQLRAGRARAATGRGASTPAPSTARARCEAPRPGRPPFLAGAAAAARRRRSSSSTTSCGSCSTRRRRSCASASASASARWTTSSTTRIPIELDGLAQWGGRRPAARGPAGRRRLDDCGRRRAGRGACCRRACSASAMLDEVRPIVEAIVARGDRARGRHRRRRASMDVRVDLGAGRARRRHRRRRRAATTLVTVDVLAGRPPSTGSRRGSGCSRSTVARPGAPRATP